MKNNVINKPEKRSKSQDESKERLHKFIARCGVCSRRKAEELIMQGRVEVNGRLIAEMGVAVSDEDEVRIDGIPIQPESFKYIVMNKPKGVVTTMDDPQRRSTVRDYLPDLNASLKPVGRLDMDTDGVLLFTNDGELAMRLTHPRHGVNKEYFAIVRGQVEVKSKGRLERGVFIEGRKTSRSEVEIMHYDQKADSTHLRLVIHEGRYRQVKLMCEAVGHPVKSLRRTKFGPVHVKKMAPGMCRTLGKSEVDELKKLVGLN